MPGEKNLSEDTMMGDYGGFFRVGDKEQVVGSYRRLEHKAGQSGRIMCFQAAIGMTYATDRVDRRNECRFTERMRIVKLLSLLQLVFARR